jgi:hypothetical protein
MLQLLAIMSASPALMMDMMADVMMYTAADVLREV